MRWVKKLGLAAVGLGVLGWLFLTTLEDTIAEPYSVDPTSFSGWTLELAAPGGARLALLGLRPPQMLRAVLFDQLFARTMASMVAPPDDLLPVVLATEFRDLLSAALSPDEILTLAREAGLDRVTLEPVCMAVKRAPAEGRTRELYVVVFEAPAVTAFRDRLGRQAADRGATGFPPPGFSPVLPVAASDPGFASWWPLRVDRVADCQAPIE